MDGWRGLMVLSLGLVIGVLLWLGVASLVAPSPPPRILVVEGPQPEGTTGALAPSAPSEAMERPEPFAVVEANVLAGLLESAPFVHRGVIGPVLYVVMFRSCPKCVEFTAMEWAGLEGAGIDLRWIVYARRDKDGQERSSGPERAMVAELALNRSYALLADWLGAASPEAFYQATELPIAAESEPDRLRAVENTRTLIDSLEAIAFADGHAMTIPAFLWQEAGTWHAMFGYDAASFASVKQGLLRSSASAASAPLPTILTPPHATSAPPATPGIPR